VEGEIKSLIEYRYFCTCVKHGDNAGMLKKYEYKLQNKVQENK